MNKIFKIFDIYGSDFNLRINGETKFKSAPGGILSMLTIAVLIWTVVSFGRDFYLRENPRITIEDGIYPGSEIPVLNGSNYQERILVLQYEKIFDKMIKPMTMQINEDGSSKDIYLTECSKEYLYNKTIITPDLNSIYESYAFYCIKLNDFNIGGKPTSVDSSGPLPLIIQWNDCNQLDDSEILTNNLTSCDKTFNDTLSIMRMTVWYEKIGFSPNSKNPFVKKLSSFFNVFNTEKSTFLYYPLNLFNLKDDIGWISNDVQTSLDFNIAPGNIISYPETVKELKYPRSYVIIYVSDDFKVFSRTYSKLQDLLATIGGFMKLVFSILNIFNTFIRIYLIDYYLVNKLFDNVSQPINMFQTSGSMCVSPPITKRKSIYSASRKSNIVNLSIKTELEQKRGSHIKLRSIEKSDKSKL